MRTVLIVGNWKMNKTASEAAAFVRALTEHLPSPSTAVELVVAPPFTALESVRAALGPSLQFSSERKTCFGRIRVPTPGEVSAPMLKDLGCRYVILGHSERRILFGEQGDQHPEENSSGAQPRLAPDPLYRRDACRTRERHDRRRTHATTTRELVRPYRASRWPPSPSPMNRSGPSARASPPRSSKPSLPTGPFGGFLPPSPLPQSPTARGSSMGGASRPRT